MTDNLGTALYRWRIKTVLPHVKGRLLDMGCGCNELVRRHGQGQGVDVHDFGGGALILSDTSCTPFESESFDTVTILASLNHIPYREEVLREMHRVLTPSGCIIITMIPPVISRIWHWLRSPWDADQQERGMADGEVYGMTRYEVCQLLERQGFRAIRVSSFMFGINKLFIAFK